jgi:multiple sugar transport system permease protein
MMNRRELGIGKWKGFLYVLPALAIVALFVVYPLLRAFLMSFYTKYKFSTDTVLSYGIDNYTYIFGDSVFLKALSNTFIYVLFVVPISIAISLVLAVLMNEKIRLRGFFQTVYFLPYVTSVVAMGIVFGWLFHSNYGLINYLLGLLGIAPVQWLNRPSTALPALIIFSIWKSLAFNIIIFLAGLQTIGVHYYQAARVDSASKWRQFSRITVPLLSPIIAYAFIIGMISSFKVYAEVYSLFGGKPGPANSCITMVYYIYRQFYENRNFGIASAAAVVLFFIILLFTVIQLRVAKRRVHY